MASAVARELGGRRVITVGGVVYGLGFILSSATQNAATLAVTLVIIGGKNMKRVSGQVVLFKSIRLLWNGQPMSDLSFKLHLEVTLKQWS